MRPNTEQHTMIINEVDPRMKSRQFAAISTAATPHRPRKFVTERE